MSEGETPGFLGGIRQKLEKNAVKAAEQQRLREEMEQRGYGRLETKDFVNGGRLQEAFPVDGHSFRPEEVSRAVKNIVAGIYESGGQVAAILPITDTREVWLEAPRRIKALEPVTRRLIFVSNSALPAVEVSRKDL